MVHKKSVVTPPTPKYQKPLICYIKGLTVQNERAGRSERFIFCLRGYHVHTNMAKASLSMMTLTMAKEYKKDRIFIVSVDPDWVSNQFPQTKNLMASSL